MAIQLRTYSVGTLILTDEESIISWSIIIDSLELKEIRETCGQLASLDNVNRSTLHKLFYGSGYLQYIVYNISSYIAENRLIINNYIIIMEYMDSGHAWLMRIATFCNHIADSHDKEQNDVQIFQVRVSMAKLLSLLNHYEFIMNAFLH